MNIETLRRAAERIRAELCYGGSGHAFYAGVADWLDDVAEASEVGWGEIGMRHALTVARAYLGESS